MSNFNLELYFFYECPFCQFVLNVLEQHNIKYTQKNIRENQTYLEKLVNDTGRQTVPCLYINDRPMHESRDIIKWLEDNLEQLPKN